MAEGSFSLQSEPVQSSSLAARRRAPPMAPVLLKTVEMPKQAKVILNVSAKLKHTSRSDIETVFSELNTLGDELIIDMDYVIRFAGNRIILEVFGYETAKGKIKLEKPLIFYRSSGRSRGDDLANIYLPSCLGDDHNVYIVTHRNCNITDESDKNPVDFISYGIVNAIGDPTIPKEPESYIISTVQAIENFPALSRSLMDIDFFKDPKYLDNKLNANVFRDINKTMVLLKTAIHNMKNKLNSEIIGKIPFEYFNIFYITLNDLLKYGRLLNKEIALMAKWLFDNNDMITLQAFIFNHYYMKSKVVDSYNYSNMIQVLDKIKEIDNQNIFRYKFKTENWFNNHCNEYLSAKPNDFMIIDYDKITKRHKASRKSQSGGYKKKTKRVKQNYKK